MIYINFLEAMQAAKEGKKVARGSWASNHAHVVYNNSDLEWGSIDHPYQHFHPMINDIFAEDWSIL